MRKVHIDFESRSKVDIWSSGAYVYASDDSTEVMCLAYAVDNGPVQVIRFQDIIMTELGSDAFRHLRELATAEDTLFYAHNALFEQLIWQHQLQVKYHLPRLPINRWRCTAAKALAHGLPKSLKDCAKALGCKEQKDERGRLVMLKLCRPKADGTWEENPELIKELEAYCQQDVETEREIDNSLPELNPTEQYVWFEDQLINQRGIAVDVDAVSKCLSLADAETLNLKKELQALTGGALDGVSRRLAVMDYFAKKGCKLPDFTKSTVETVIKAGKLPPDLLQVLRIRQQLGLTSIAKYTALKEAVCADRRLRDTLLYHSASTGRWGGKLVQLQNLPKGTVKDTNTAVELIKTTDIDTLRMMYDNIMGLLSSCIRGMFISAPGCDLIVSDYSAIEARVLMWFVGQDDAVKMFNEGTDIYVKMAERIGSGASRQLGKQAVLGCIAEDSMVYSDKGFIPIQTINQGQRLWNGEQWVNFRELVQVGKKNVIQIGDLWLTPDHRLLTNRGWQTAAEIALSGDIQHLLSEKRSEDGRLQAESFTEVRNVVSLSAVNAALTKIDESTSYGGRLQTLVANVAKVSKGNLAETPVDTLISLLIHAYERGGASVGTTFEEDVQTQITVTSKGMVLEAFPSVSNHVESSWNTLLQSMGLILGDSLSIELIMPKGTQKEIFESLHREKTIETKVKECWDLVGVDTESFQVNQFIAHNCGYGMGVDKFQATCATYGINIDSVLAEKAVQAYRTTFKRVPDMWYKQERAMKAAIQTKERIDCGKVSWCVDARGRDFLYCTLPSGRRLAFHKARVEGDKVTYFTTDSVTKKYVRKDTYGGKIIENIIQATARDIMAHAMLNAEKAGYKVVLTVHDELVVEVPEGFGSVEEFNKIITTLPTWATGCPISAEGWRGKRYKK